MIKLIDLLKEEDFFTPRRSKEERSKNYNIILQKKIQQYIKDGSKGDLYLSNTKITSLPNDLKVGGYLELSDSKIETLPIGLKVGGDLYLNDTQITSLPNDLEVGGSLFLNDTPIAKKYTKEQIRRMVPNVKGSILI
jgi:hypothetical protein